jgi:hypothetical protein
LADTGQVEIRNEPEPVEEPLRLWTASSGAPSIEFSVALVEEIRSEVVRALHGMGRGGVEVGGILLGAFDGDKYVIDLWRPVRCGHSRGASFLLSDRDVATLSCQIEAVQVDPAFEGRSVMGWFVSHTRGGLEPRIEESQLHMSHFDTPGTLLLTVQPSRFGDAQAIIHIFEPGEPPALLPLDPPLNVLPAPGFRNPAGDARGSAPAILPWLDDTPVDSLTPPSFTRRWLPWLVGAASLAFFVLGLIAVRGQKQIAQNLLAKSVAAHVEPSGPPRALLSVHLEKAADSIQISWDTSSPAVAGASSGVLTVLDQGNMFSRDLAASELKLGRIDYTRSMGEIRVRLTVETATGRLVEEAHYAPFHLP